MESELEVWQEKMFNLEILLLETDDDRKVRLIKNRIKMLDEKINWNKKSRYEERSIILKFNLHLYNKTLFYD